MDILVTTRLPHLLVFSFFSFCIQWIHLDSDLQDDIEVEQLNMTAMIIGVMAVFIIGGFIISVIFLWGKTDYLKKRYFPWTRMMVRNKPAFSLRLSEKNLCKQMFSLISVLRCLSTLWSTQGAFCCTYWRSIQHFKPFLSPPRYSQLKKMLFLWGIIAQRVCV